MSSNFILLTKKNLQQPKNKKPKYYGQSAFEKKCFEKFIVSQNSKNMGSCNYEQIPYEKINSFISVISLDTIMKNRAFI